MPLGYPISNEDKGTIEETEFSQIKANTFRGGLPVLASVPTYTGKNGETILYNTTSTARLYAYLGDSWKKLGDTDFSDTGIMNDLIDDTTPQLGGDLDTNDKAITSEGGKIEVHTLTKALTGGTSISLFSINVVTDGAVAIFIDFMASMVPNDANTAIHIGQHRIAYGSKGVINDADYITEAESGKTIAITWTEDIFDPPLLIVKVQSDVVTGNLNSTITAKITIISTTSNFTYTAL